MHTTFGNSVMPSAMANAAREISFGDFPVDMIYAGGVREMEYKSNDKRQQILEKKLSMIQKDLLTTTNEYASGVLYSAVAGNLPVLIPIYVDKEIIDLVRRETPLYELLPKRAIQGKFYDYNVMNARGAATFRNEGAAMPAADDTYARAVVPVKYAYSVGKVTGPSYSAMKGYIDILKEQVQTHTQSLVQLLETTIINGNAPVNPQEFSGLLITIVTNVQALLKFVLT